MRTFGWRGISRTFWDIFGDSRANHVNFKVLEAVAIDDPPYLIHLGGRAMDQNSRTIFAAMTHESLQGVLDKGSSENRSIRECITDWLHKYNFSPNFSHNFSPNFSP